MKRPAPQCNWLWLMHRLPICQSQRPNVNGNEWCTKCNQKLPVDCARAQRFLDFDRTKIWRYDFLNLSAPAMNSFKQLCPWCDFSVMRLEIFVAPTTRDMIVAPWWELSRVFVAYTYGVVSRVNGPPTPPHGMGGVGTRIRYTYYISTLCKLSTLP